MVDMKLLPRTLRIDSASAASLALAISLSVLGCSGAGPGSGGVDAVGSADGPPRADLARHEVTSGGHPMAVWEKSAPDPSAIVLLVHGRTWSTVPDFDLQLPGEDLSLMDGLIGMGLSAYGVDLRGYGETPRDDTGWNTPARAAADVANTLRWIRARHPDVPVHLFGWSLGSMVSQLAAQENGELVDRLVLFGYPYRPGAAREIETPDGPPAMAPTTAEAAASDFILPGSISQAAIDAYVSAALEADPVRSDWTAGHEWNALDPASVTVPTLILQGEHDPLSPAASVSILFDGLGTSDKAWVVVPGGDHAAFLEAPRAYFLSALESFLLRGEM
jgi:alpha-beta hydrolase superfamily lysophospholipase